MKIKAIIPDELDFEFGALNRTWTLEEHLKMIEFLKLNKEYLTDYIRNFNQSKRSNHRRRFFSEMASYISTKTTKQCKSRFQKREKKLLYLAELEEDHVSDFLGKKYDKSLKQKLKGKGEEENTKPSGMEPESRKITNYKELRDCLVDEILGDIKNELIKNQMIRFIRYISDDLDPQAPLASFNINSISMIYNDDESEDDNINDIVARMRNPDA